jgi:hypothetical protein
MEVTMKYLRSLKKAWNGKTLNERDYNNLSDLMIIPISIFVLMIVF